MVWASCRRPAHGIAETAVASELQLRTPPGRWRFSSAKKWPPPRADGKGQRRAHYFWSPARPPVSAQSSKLLRSAAWPDSSVVDRETLKGTTRPRRRKALPQPPRALIVRARGRTQRVIHYYCLASRLASLTGS
jgi:hypothetical protein